MYVSYPLYQAWIVPCMAYDAVRKYLYSADSVFFHFKPIGVRYCGYSPALAILGSSVLGFCLPACTGNVSALFVLVLLGTMLSVLVFDSTRNWWWWSSIARNNKRTRQIHRWERWRTRSIFVTPPCLFERRQPPKRYKLFMQQYELLLPLLSTAGTLIVPLYENGDPVRIKPRPPSRSMISQVGYTMTTSWTAEWLHEHDLPMYSRWDMCAANEVTWIAKLGDTW